MSQKERVLERLQAGPACGTEFLKMHIPRYAARIYELRGEGYQIDNEACRDYRHGHQTAQVRFVLEAADQIALPI